MHANIATKTNTIAYVYAPFDSSDANVKISVAAAAITKPINSTAAKMYCAAVFSFDGFMTLLYF